MNMLLLINSENNTIINGKRKKSNFLFEKRENHYI